MRAIAGLVALSAFLGLASPACAGASDAGTAAGLFLALGPGARAAAMGEAYTAVVDEASAMYWNPAALSRIERRSVHLMHASYLGAADFEYLALGHSLGRYGAFGAAVQSVSAKGITQTDVTGVSGGTFSTSDAAYSLGYALSASTGPWAGAALGLVGKRISSRVATTAHAHAFDVGALSPGLFDDRLRLAFTVSNVGSRLKYDQASEKLPQIVRLGAAARPVRRLLASLDVSLPSYESAYVAAGGEAVLGSSEGVQAAARVGFNSRALSDVSGFNGVSFGLGLSAGGWSFDYGLVPFGPLGVVHRFSLNVRF